MEKITPIKEELKQLGSGLGNFPVVNPYKVPAGYFDDFPARMFTLVSGASLPAALSGLPAPYQVPDGYFDNLADIVLKKAKAASELNKANTASELKKASAASKLNKANTASELKKASASSDGNQSPLPERSASEKTPSEHPASESGNFGESAADELAGLSSILSGIVKKTPFTVPDNYFNELSGNIVSGARAVDMVNEELENLSPLMASLKPINVFSVPNEYFQELPGIVLNRVLDKEKTSDQVSSRVVKGIFGRRIMQYAAAAVITGLMITAGFFFVNRNPTQPELVSIKGLQEKAAQTSDEEILNYLATQHVPLVDSLINIDPEIKADAIMEMLANVSDEELQQYLQLQSDTKILIN